MHVILIAIPVRVYVHHTGWPWLSIRRCLHGVQSLCLLLSNYGLSNRLCLGRAIFRNMDDGSRDLLLHSSVEGSPLLLPRKKLKYQYV